MNSKKMTYETKRKIALSSIAVFCIIITTLACVAAVFLIYGEVLHSSKSAQLNKAEKYAEQVVDTPKGGVVFLGDSIFEMYELNKWYKDKGYINRGISSNESADILNRLQTNVIDIEPKVIILHVGANDIGHGVKSDTYLTNMDKIISQITTSLPDCTLLVDSIYPTVTLNSFNSRNLTKKRDNASITNLNSRLNNICNKYSATNKVKFLTATHSSLLEKGKMNKTYTIDGLHLSDFGYRIITRQIDAEIQKLAK